MRASSALFVAAAIAVERAAALSSGCTSELGILALSDLSCLDLTSALPLLSTTGSVISGVNTYLSSVCTSGNTCSNSSLTSAQSSIQSSCASDLSGGGDGATEVEALLVALQNYPQLYAAACSKNTTTGDYCVTDTLTTVQTDIGQNITIDFVSSAISGTGNSRQQIEQAFATGNLCTGCVSNIYYEALSANSTLSSTSIGQAINSQCGSSFGTNAAATGVSTAGVSATSTAASSSASSSSSSKSGAERSINGLASGAVALVGLALGARFIL